MTKQTDEPELINQLTTTLDQSANNDNENSQQNQDIATSPAESQDIAIDNLDSNCSQPVDHISDNDDKAQDNEQKRSKKAVAIEYTKRILFLFVGLVIMAFGVAFSVNASLGTSPVSSIPYVTSLTSGLSLGTTTIIVNTLIVLMQIPILRKKFKLVRLLQIPVCTIFGLLIDLASLCIADIMPSNYILKWLLCIVGIVLVAIGVSFEVTANVITLAGEGLVQSVCMVSKIKFGNMKVIVDVSMVVIAVAISFIFLHTLQGVREGTVAAAIFVGLLSKQFNKIIMPLGNKIFSAKETKK